MPAQGDPVAFTVQMNIGTNNFNENLCMFEKSFKCFDDDKKWDNFSNRKCDASVFLLNYYKNRYAKLNVSWLYCTNPMLMLIKAYCCNHVTDRFYRLVTIICSRTRNS